MKKHIIFISLLSVLCLFSCKDKAEKVTFEFNAEVEQPLTDDKVRLENESKIYFEAGDTITIASDATPTNNEEPITATLYGGRGTVGTAGYYGNFRTELSETSTKFIAVYPQNNNIEIRTLDAAQCYFPEKQPYVDDNTFGKNSYPMIAYCDNANHVLQFHALCGIARIQFYAPTASGYIIKNIKFEENTGKKISGIFTVNNFKTYDPYVSGGGSSTVTIDCSGSTVNAKQLKTFYLTLPALSAATEYKLKMTLNDGETDAHHITITVPIKRRCITKINAINANEWNADGVGICGNGTPDRPFEIYTAADLIKVRKAFNETPHTLNGIDVTTNNCNFLIKRSDIRLDGSNWTAGIENFKGIMEYKANTSSSGATSNPGITNTSTFPLFTSISADGTVKGITIKGSGSSSNISSTGTYSPFCGTNLGTIEGCHIANTVIFTSSTANLAGICATNGSTGIIRGCGNVGQFNAGTTCNAAGICYTNKGTIEGCSQTSPVVLKGKEVGGICHTNNRTIQDCYFSANVGSSATCSFGGIAFKQASSESSDPSIVNCQIQTSTEIVTSGTCGGIVNTMEAGTLDYCGNISLHSSSARLNGGIVAMLTGGTVINCYCDLGSSTLSVTGSTDENYCGGIVAEMQAGTVTNSFAKTKVSSVPGKSGSVVGHYKGGSISNCYGWESPSGNPFYGENTASSYSISNCWNYSAATSTITGITSFTTTSNLLSSLNTNKPYGGRSWSMSTDTEPHPILSTSSTAKGRKLQRRK